MSKNVRQTDIMMFLTDKFNENTFEIPFRQGFYQAQGQDDLNIVWYKPKLNDKGLFDIEDSFDTETYAFNKNRFVVMQTDVSTGDYIGLPSVKMGSYTSNIEIMVYADDPLILITTKMAIEEIRDSFIGTQHFYKVEEQNENTVDDVYLKIVTNAGGIDYGNEIVIKGRKFLIMSFTVDVTISKNVDFGNQVKWQVSKYDEDTSSWSAYETVVPLISSWGVSQDMASEQTLNSLNPIVVDKSKEVHNYVKSRGWGMTFTFIKTSDNTMIREMFKESINTPTTPPLYKIKMEFGEYDENLNVIVYKSDMSFEKICVYGEAEPADIVYGEPIVFAIGFVVSSKKVL